MFKKVILSKKILKTGMTLSCSLVSKPVLVYGYAF